MTVPVPPQTRTSQHGTVVAFGASGVLIIGPSGSGKSGLALELVALGGKLVADDRAELRLLDGAVVATCPAGFAGQIEARGVGLLAVPSAPNAVVRLVVDMGQVETERLPPERRMNLNTCDLPLLHKVESRHFVAAIMLYLSGGRIA